MKRFYEQVGTDRGAAGWEVHLDGRAVRTPAKAPLVLPGAALAEAIAGEWAAQEETVDPAAMPLLRLACTAIDRVAPRRDGVIDEIAAFGGSDLLCYRATEPDALVARQDAAWQPLLDWAAARLDARLRVTVGVAPVAQPDDALAALRAAVAGRDDMTLSGLHALAAATGSLILSLAILEGEIAADAVWGAAQLDEDWQIEKWGEDAEATAQRSALRADIDATLRFLALAAL
ncbi:MAG: ATP12 family chaperone protein [Alphaproteobacteria bacterium]